MNNNQPKGSAAVASVQQTTTSNKNCNKTEINKRCNNKFSNDFCNKISAACPSEGEKKMECNISSKDDDKECLTCTEAYNKICKTRNNIPSECQANTLTTICNESFENFINIDNINHYDNILLYIVMLFIMYKIIYKK